MVSGPDLGAGFLYQLTRVRDGSRARFTFHAQEGGQDASGPPIGTPEPFGWSMAGTMCPFGGRHCWHRSFDTDDRQVAAVRAAYNRSRFVMEAQLAQAYRGAPVPWEEALDEWARRVAPALAREGLPWCLTGTAARRIGGGAGPVPEVTIWTDEAGVRAAAEAIPEYLIEPAASTTWEDRPVFAARAFVGTLVRGVRLEWAGFAPGAPARDGFLRVDWGGHDIPIAPSG